MLHQHDRNCTAEGHRRKQPSADSLRLRTVFARRPPADSSEVCHARMNAHKMNRAANAAPSDRNGEKDIGRDKV